MNKENPIIKSRFFNFDPRVNVGKLELLQQTHKEYLIYTQSCIDLMLKNGIFDVSKKEKRKFFQTSESLSSQIIKNAQGHAIGVVKGWVKTCYINKLRAHITFLRKEKIITPKEAKTLYTIGKYSKFTPTNAISQEAVTFYLTLLYDPDISCKPPVLSETSEMRLSEMTADFREPETASMANLWVNISTLEKGKRTSFPVVSNPYITSLDQISKGLSLRFLPGGGCRLEAVDQADFSLPEPNHELPYIGVDPGLNVLAATSDGWLHGASHKPKIVSDYDKIAKIRANRKQQGLYEDSPRLKKLESKKRGFLNTIVGEITNLLVSNYPIGTIFIMEQLDLSGLKGAQKMSYQKLGNSLERKANVIRINPAYTSQRCPSCGSVCKLNRDGTKFRCRVCGKKGHADVIGAIGIKERFFDESINCETDPSDVREYLRGLYWNRRNPGKDCPLEFLGKKPSRKRRKAPEPSGPSLTVRVNEATQTCIDSNQSLAERYSQFVNRI